MVADLRKNITPGYTLDLQAEDIEQELLEHAIITHCETFLEAQYDRCKIIRALTFGAQYLALSSHKQDIVNSCWDILKLGSEDILKARKDMDDLQDA